MSALASWLLAASAAILLLLGTLHLLYTFRGRKLHPRDPDLQLRMQQASPMISRETTMWKAWLGFNATHSYGAMLYGLVYGYLALAHPAFLFGSAYLQSLGAVLLAGYLVIGWKYFFSVPFRGIALASVLYAAGLVAAWLG